MLRSCRSLMLRQHCLDLLCTLLYVNHHAQKIFRFGLILKIMKEGKKPQIMPEAEYFWLYSMFIKNSLLFYLFG